MTDRRWAPIVVVLALAAGCRDRSRPAAVVDAGVAGPARAVPAWFPSTLDPTLYTGAAACADCHRAIYEQWRKSPHGRAMAPASPESVLGDFSGTPVRLAGGTLTPRREGADYVMEIEVGSVVTRHRVELVLASGRQHQLYLTRGPGGTLQLLPVYFATRTREWIDTGLYRGTSLDPADPRHWARVEVVTDGNCFYCHLSQGRSRPGAERVEISWVDLSINCEACHGAGRAHAEARLAGREDHTLVNPKNLDRAEEAALCGRCHAAQHTFHDERGAVIHYSTPAGRLLRSDATQFGAGYQYAGHVSSGCVSRGAATCSGCHDPHRQTARSLAGESAEGKDSDKQCTVCHRDRLDGAVARRHTHHAAKVRCVDCHMPLHWLFDDEKSRQRVSDHAISIPRPRETIDLKLQNACGNCHGAKGPEWALSALQKWGYRAATETRPFVQAVARAKKGDRGALAPLVAALTAADASPLVRATALDAIALLPPDPAAVAALGRFAEDRDSYVRGLAFRALWTQDVARRDAWVAGALGDPDPMVRVMALDALDRVQLSDAQLDRLVDDALLLDEMPPTGVLEYLAERYWAQGREVKARELIDLALSRATPIETARLAPMRDQLRGAHR